MSRLNPERGGRRPRDSRRDAGATGTHCILHDYLAGSRGKTARARSPRRSLAARHMPMSIC